MSYMGTHYSREARETITRNWVWRNMGPHPCRAHLYTLRLMYDGVEFSVPKICPGCGLPWPVMLETLERHKFMERMRRQ